MGDGTRDRVRLLADDQVLTTEFAVASNMPSVDLRHVSNATIYREYTPAAGEANNTFCLFVETSIDGTNWHHNGSIDVSTPTSSVDSPLTFTTDPTSGGETNLALPIQIDVNGLFFRVKIKEVGVTSNVGTATVYALLRYL